MENLETLRECHVDPVGVGATYNAHALPSGDQSRYTNDEANSRQDSPTTPSVAESNKDTSNHATNDATEAKPTGEDHAGSVAIADSPADEVRVSLMT